MDDRRVKMLKLSPQAIESIARRVIELLPRDVSAQVELVDAAELAKRLGVDRSWVYTHAIELGAIRLGGGSRPRLRFDPQLAIARIRARAERSADERLPQRRPRTRLEGGARRPRLLPIKGGGANSPVA